MTGARLAVPLLIAAFASAPAGAGTAAIRTLAWVVSECRSDAAGLTGRQELRIRRGNRPPVTVMEFDPAAPMPDPLRLCRNFGEYRNGGIVFRFPDRRACRTPGGSHRGHRPRVPAGYFPRLQVLASA